LKRIDEVINLLADGQFHSGEDVGGKLGISRSAIWKIVKQLEELGLDVHRVQGRGYCIPGGIQFFSEEKIRQHLSAEANQQLKKLDVFDCVNSTNSYLNSKVKDNWPSGSVCVAEHQTEGRARQGRHWVSPYGKNIYMSLLWKFAPGPSALTGLTLLVGLAIIRALSKMNIMDLHLKWPNDVMWHGAKLAGVLTEINIDDINGCHAIIGIGLNLHISPKMRAQIDKRIIDVQTILGCSPDKNTMTAFLLEELFAILPEFEKKGFEAFVEQWESYDLLRTKKVTVQTAHNKVMGVAQGIDHTGALTMRVNGQIERFYSGEVSIEEFL
jgi:BirA family biotin operon repressor/biotin-[acetyl-CoA-carboxylase] ligase